MSTQETGSSIAETWRNLKAVRRASNLQVTKQVIRENTGGRHQMYDSRMGPSSNIFAFDGSFGALTPRQNLRDYVETELQPVAGQAIGIEFGGPGSNLFAGFSEGFFRQTAGITLVDLRRDEKKDLDTKNRHTIIPGDMQTPDTQKKVSTWLGGQKAHFIIERMGLGHESLPQNPYLLARIARFGYSTLAENGLMFLQVPLVMDPVIEPWMQMIEQKFGDSLQVTRPRNTVAALRIEKRPGAPMRLPLLHGKPPRTNV